MKRIPPSSKVRQEIEEVLVGWEAEGHPLDSFVRLGARYILQVAVEHEVEDYLGRVRIPVKSGHLYRSKPAIFSGNSATPVQGHGSSTGLKSV